MRRGATTSCYLKRASSIFTVTIQLVQLLVLDRMSIYFSDLITGLVSKKLCIYVQFVRLVQAAKQKQSLEYSMYNHT